MALKKWKNMVNKVEESTDKDDNSVVIQLSEDILDQLFGFLPIASLCKCAQVCKLWHKVAQRENSKRGLYTVVIDPDSYEISDVIHQFRVKPKLSLYFCGSRPHYRNASNTEYAILTRFTAKFPFMNDTIILGAEHAMLDTQEIKSCQEFDPVTNIYYSPNGTLGVILPDIKDLNVKYAWCEKYDGHSSEHARRIFEQLQPNEHQGNPVYLMFGMNGCSVGSLVLTMLREKYGHSQPNIWGGTMARFIKCNDSYPQPGEVEQCTKLPHLKYLSVHGFLGILLQRPRLSVYSTVVSLDDNLTTRRSRFTTEIKLRLLGFKAEVELRRRSLGFVCGPHSKDKVYIYEPIMEVIKQQFPTVSFVGYFNSPELHYYGCDNTTTDASKNLIHEKAISIMILTYN